MSSIRTIYYIFRTFPNIFLDWLKMFSLDFVQHASLTFPSILYHTIYDQYLRSHSEVRHNSLPEGIHNVVVCVHGRGGHATDFEYLINQLKSDKYHFLAFHLKNNSHTSVSDDVKLIKTYLIPLMSRINKIIFIGLSKGGLTSIKYAIEYPEKIEKIITVSSPLNGTYVANNYPFCKNTRKELSYKSKFTEEIRELSKHLPIYSIVPKYDHMIIPTNSAHYPHCKTYFYSGYYSHSGILYSSEVINQIKDWIGF
jgi:pimeloyl-ACP methyl ester carboxylesterase